MAKIDVSQALNWLDIKNDFRSVGAVYLSHQLGNDKFFVPIKNPRPHIRVTDPSYINTSLGDVASLSVGPLAAPHNSTIDMLTKLKAVKAIDSITQKYKLTNAKQSVHTYLLAAAILEKQRKKGNQQINLLEIGTFDGANARHLALLSDNIMVHTFDPSPERSPTSWKYNDNTDKWSDDHYDIRRENILLKNIKYYPMSSSQLLSNIRISPPPDIIWIDGDHRFPQIAIDLSAMLSLYKDSLIFVDDVYLARSNNATVETLRFLARDLRLKIIMYQKEPGAGKFVAIVGNNIPNSFVPEGLNHCYIKYNDF